MKVYAFTQPNYAPPRPAAGSLALEEIRVKARARHEKARRAARARGRVDFPDLPFECSWAFETGFFR